MKSENHISNNEAVHKLIDYHHAKAVQNEMRQDYRSSERKDRQERQMYDQAENSLRVYGKALQNAGAMLKEIDKWKMQGIASAMQSLLA